MDDEDRRKQRTVVTCPSRRTLTCQDPPSWGPRPDHHGAGAAAAWVMSLSVWAGFDSHFDKLRNYIGVHE